MPDPKPSPPADPPWSQALFSMLDPVQTSTVEILAWTQEPLSAKLLYEVMGRDWPVGTVGYHVRRLAETV